MAVAVVNKADDVEVQVDSIVSPPADQRGKAIRAADDAAMLCWAALHLSPSLATRLPQLDRSVLTGRGQPLSVRAERDAKNPASVGFQREQFPPRRRVP